MQEILLVNNYEGIERGQFRVAAIEKGLNSAAQAESISVNVRIVRGDKWNFEDVYAEAIVLSGGPSNPTREAIQGGWMRRESQWLKRLVLETNTPLLGICFGHEILGTSFGTELVQRPKENQVLRTLRKVQEDPLLEKGEFSLVMSHECELPTVPAGFDLIAEGVPPASRVQIIRFRGKPAYGVQGHPELGGDGWRIFRRFLDLVK